MAPINGKYYIYLTIQPHLQYRLSIESHRMNQSNPNTLTIITIIFSIITQMQCSIDQCLSPAQIEQAKNDIYHIHSQDNTTNADLNDQLLSAGIFDKQEVLMAYKNNVSKIGQHYLIEIEEDQYEIRVKSQNQGTHQIDWQAESVQDTVGFSSSNDVWAYIKPTPVILTCNENWAVKIGCGTFLEIHRPFQAELLVSKQIQQTDQGPFNIPINILCAGTYHIWFVYVTRIGKVVKTVQPIFVSFPPCNCI